MNQSVRKLLGLPLLVLICIGSTQVFALNLTGQQRFEGLQLAQVSSNQLSSDNPEVIYGPVQKKESLWIIAKPFQPPYTTMPQLVMAIYEKNPDSFISNNINRLKPGSMLAIPSEEEIRAIDYRAAYREIKLQIEAYKAFLHQESIKSSDGGQETQNESTGLALVDQVIKSELTEESGLEQGEQSVLAAQMPIASSEIMPSLEAKHEHSGIHHEKPRFRYSYDVSIANDDNIRRAQNESDIRGDLVSSFTLNARAARPLSGSSLLLYGGSITYQHFDVFDELDNLKFLGNTKYRFSNSVGFTAPSYTFGLKIGGIESESEMRDSTLFSISADMNKWLTTTINMTTGVGYKLRESKSKVFDTREARAFINLDVDISRVAVIYGTYTYLTGDIVSSATPSLQFINWSDAIEPDDAFGGVVFNQFAYRLDADTNVITLGYNRILTRSASVDFSYQFVDTEAVGGIYYEREIIRASLLGRF